MSVQRYLFRTPGAERRVMHIATYSRSGEMTDVAFCGRHGFNRSVNAPWRSPRLQPLRQCAVGTRTTALQELPARAGGFTEAHMSRRQGQPLRFCVYCGAAIGSHLVACDDHSDLPPLDPNYQMRQDRPMLKAVK